MPNNRIRAEISKGGLLVCLAAIETIRQNFPFLIDLSPEQRRARAATRQP